MMTKTLSTPAAGSHAEQIASLEAMLASPLGEDILRILRHEDKRIVIGEEKGSLLGYFDTFYLDGDGLRQGMVEAYLNNQPISLPQRAMTAMEAIGVALDERMSEIPLEKRSNVTKWIIDTFTHRT
jgi:hypothetical protein